MHSSSLRPYNPWSYHCCFSFLTSQTKCLWLWTVSLTSVCASTQLYFWQQVFWQWLTSHWQTEVINWREEGKNMTTNLTFTPTLKLLSFFLRPPSGSRCAGGGHSTVPHHLQPFTLIGRGTRLPAHEGEGRLAWLPEHGGAPRHRLHLGAAQFPLVQGRWLTQRLPSGNTDSCTPEPPTLDQIATRTMSVCQQLHILCASNRGKMYVCIYGRDAFTVYVIHKHTYTHKHTHTNQPLGEMLHVHWTFYLFYSVNWFCTVF